MKGLLGEEAKKSSEELAKTLRIGNWGLIALSAICGYAVYATIGLAIAKMTRLF